MPSTLFIVRKMIEEGNFELKNDMTIIDTPIE